MLTIKEAAKYLHISASKCYVLKRDIPHYRIGGKILFQTSDLDAYLSSCRVARTSESSTRASRTRTTTLKCLRLRLNATMPTSK